MTSPRQTEWMSRTVDSFMTMQQDEGVDPPGPQSFKVSWRSSKKCLILIMKCGQLLSAWCD